MRHDLMAQAALTYHKTVEGEYGCPGLECPGVKRLITFGQECAALTAQGETATKDARILTATYNEAAKAYEALAAIVRAYDAYRERGVQPAPAQYQGVVDAINAARKIMAPQFKGETAPAPVDERQFEHDPDEFVDRGGDSVEKAAASPVPAAEGPDELARLRDWARSYMRGGCHVLTLGDKCLCPLCDLDRLAAALCPPVAAEGLVETLARETAAEVRRLAYDQVLLRYDAVKAEAIVLAALRAVAEGRR